MELQVRAKKLEEKLRDVEVQKERAMEANARLQEQTAELKRDEELLEEALQQLEVSLVNNTRHRRCFKFL